MATFRDARADDPIYQEGPQSYNLHGARPFVPSKAASPSASNGMNAQEGDDGVQT